MIVFLLCFFEFRNVKVVDPVEESVSEGSDSFGKRDGDGRALVEREPCGSRLTVTVGVMLREGKLVSSCNVALR